jgi:hypothetical protein
MERVWLTVAVVFYPITASPYLFVRRDRFSALASGLVIFLILWLYVLPRDLAWSIGPVVWQSRFAWPLTAYLGGLAVAAVLMSRTKRTNNTVP